jgi:hypothetical protein
MPVASPKSACSRGNDKMGKMGKVMVPMGTDEG